MIPGPPPKKDAERRRRNKSPEAEGSLSSIPAEVINVDELLVGEVTIPEPDPNWHPIALEIYESVPRSGQVIWMEPSDFAILYLTCESLSRDLKPQVIGIAEDTGKPVMATIPLKGGSLNAYLSTFTSLMMLEGGRRKLRIELERKKRVDAAASGENVVDLVKHRHELFSSG